VKVRVHQRYCVKSQPKDSEVSTYTHDTQSHINCHFRAVKPCDTTGRILENKHKE
jgi:hypothetical protein